MRRIAVAVLALATFWAFTTPATAAGTVALVSRTSASAAATGSDTAGSGALNAKGTKIAFTSAAPADEHIDGVTDENGLGDVFVYDVATGSIKLVSHVAGNPTTAADGESNTIGISPSGRFIAYQSFATDVVGGFTETSSDPDLYVYDTKSKKANLVSHAFDDKKTDSNGFAQTDLDTIAEKKVDGKLYPVVVWETAATNVIADFNDSNGTTLRDVYLYDGKTKKNALVTHNVFDTKKGSDPCGAFCPVPSGFRITPNGRTVVYTSDAHDLVENFDDNNGDLADGSDVYVYNAKTKTNTLVSHGAASASTGSDGGSDGGVATPDGRYVVYRSAGSNLNIAGGDGSYDNNGTGFGSNRDIFLYDQKTKATELVTHTTATKTETGTGTALSPSISDDGRYITFAATKAAEFGAFTDANGTNFNGGRDVFQLDRATGALGTFTLVSRSGLTPGSTGNAQSSFGRPTADGRYVAIDSLATDLLSVSFTDNNTTNSDLFLWDRTTNAMHLVTRSATNANAGADGNSAMTGIASKAPRIGFNSQAGNLITGFDDNNSAGYDVFAYTLP